MLIMVIEIILSFNFHEKTSDDKLLLAFHRSILLNREELVRPGPAWRNILIDSKLLEYLTQTHLIMLNKQNMTNAKLIRESLHRLCSLSVK